MVKRKYFLILFLTIFLFFMGAFWPPFSSIISVGTVQGEKYYSPRVTSEEAWFAGYSIFILRPPIYHVFGDDNVVWKNCHNLSDRIARIFHNYKELSDFVVNPFEYIVEMNESGYSAYLRSSGILLYFQLYADKSGDLYDQNKYGVCNSVNP